MQSVFDLLHDFLRNFESTCTRIGTSITMKKLNIIVLFMISMIITAQEPVGGSIFPYNTCIEPCWMGITPGISTSLDIDQMLEQHDEIVTIGEYGITISRFQNGEYAVDNTTGIIQRGSYHFEVLTPISTGFSTSSSRIDIRDGLVDSMFIMSSQQYDLTSQHILNTRGTPDEIHIHYIESSSDFTVSFFYLDSRIRIALKQSDDECFINRIKNNFTLQGVLYFSEQEAQKLVETVDYQGYLQNNFTAFVLDNERDVPIDMWESWLDAEVDESCFEAWQKLSPPELKFVQDTDDIGSDNQPISLFIDDTCSAPCWFGLTVGESTSQDLDDMIHTYREEFGNIRYSDVNIYSSQGVLIDGYVDIYRKNQSLGFRFDALSNTILVTIENGVIVTIISPAQRKLKIADVLSTYGDPDIITWHFGQVNQLYLIYVDESIIVQFGFVKDEPFETYNSSFKVHKIRYFSRSDIEGIFESYVLNFLDESSTRLVPIKIVQCWAEEKDICISSWWDLPEDKDIDLSPWLEVTPEVEVTSEPTP